MSKAPALALTTTHGIPDTATAQRQAIVGGGVAFEYDRPKSIFGQFKDTGVNEVAQKLDQDLQAILQEAAT
jgi:hypothetical protein